jgi:hypothetical protein
MRVRAIATSIDVARAQNPANHEELVIHFEIFLRIPAAASHYLDTNRKLLAGKLRSLRGRRERVARVVATICNKLPGHICDHDLERYHLGTVTDETVLAPLEEHLIWCARECVVKSAPGLARCGLPKPGQQHG